MAGSSRTPRGAALQRLRAVTALLVACVASPFGVPAPAAAQDVGEGRIVGQVLDGETGRPLPGAWIRVDGTTIEGLAGIDGRYVLTRVPAGERTIVVSNLGYAVKTVTAVSVPAGGTARVDVTLTPQAILVDDIAVVVSAEEERGSVNRALDLQRNAVAVTNAISAEQISRSPDGDAAAALQRVSGVSVQEGRYVFVRGLGERYTVTSLNGTRIPSPEPEKKVVPLDLFPAGLLEMVTTSKTFTPDQPGDFSGAQVNIRTREFPGRRQVTLSFSPGLNTRAAGSSVLEAPGAGLEWLALGAGDRSLPARVAASDFDNLTQAEINQMVGAFRNAWSVRPGTGAANYSLGFSLAGEEPVLGPRFGYLISGTYSRGQEIREGQVRANALTTGGTGTQEIDRFEGSSGLRSVLWGGIANVQTMLGTHTRLALSNTYNRTADHEARREAGFSENLGGAFRIDRLRYVERSIRSTQLAGEHQLGPRHRFDWSLTSSGVTREEPDRSEIIYFLDTDPVTGDPLRPAWFASASEGAVRTFGDLSGNGLEGSAEYRRTLGSGASPHQIRVGGLYRYTDRDADNRAYSITAALDRTSRELSPEEIFDGRFSEPADSVFRITPLGVGGSYTASDHLAAGFVMVELALSSRVRMITGARLEHSDVTVEAEPTVGLPETVNPTFTDVLPSLALTWQLTEQQNLRFSVSQTLARPEYRELAPVQYREVLGGDNVLGNADLVRTLIQNVDVRWEWFPDRGEVLSLGLFAKRFEDPIEQIFLATSGTRIITFANAESAENYGVELEVRKNLGGLADALVPWTLFSNVTLMHSRIQIGTGDASKTNDERAMAGQAPYVVNSGLTYASGSGFSSATLLFNVVGRRIVSASEAPLPDIYEQPRPQLDLSIRVPLFPGISAKLDAKNLLDSPHEVTQGSVTREYHRSGRVFSTGFTWKL